MNPTRLIVLTLSLLSLTQVARAASPAEEKRACVAASTEAQVARDEGHLLEAREQLLLCARDECPNVVRKSCAEWLADIDERIPSVVVRALDESGQDLTDVKLSIDGNDVPLDGRPVMLNPGQHELMVTEASGVTGERKVLLAEKEKSRLVNVSININVNGAPASQEGLSTYPDSQSDAPSEPAEKFRVPTGAWVLGGVGIAGLGAFTYFGLSAKSKLDDLEKTCSPGCSDDQTSDGKRNALLADISLGVGVLALAGAVTWIVIAKKRSKDAPAVSLLPTRTGGMAGISGRF